MATRRKTAAITAPIPNNRDEARAQMRQIGDAQRERERIQTELGDQVAALQEKYATLASPFSEKVDNLTQGLQIWAEANRNKITQDGKRKSTDLGTGELGWRTRPPNVGIRGKVVVIEVLKRMNLNQFVRSKEDINREAILADPEAVEGIKGINITQAEDFWIKPSETDLEEVT